MSHASLLVITKTPDFDEIGRLLAPYDENLEIEQVHDEEYDETYWHNPRAKWDYWVIGGRYLDRLVARNGRRFSQYPNPRGITSDVDYGPCDQARKVDVDFEAMAVQQMKKAGDWWDEAQAKSYGPFMSQIREGTSREEYVRDSVAFTSFACVTPDGEWWEKGQLLMFGCVADEDDAWPKQFQQIVREADDESWFTFVDYHI